MKNHLTACIPGIKVYVLQGFHAEGFYMPGQFVELCRASRYSGKAKTHWWLCGFKDELLSILVLGLVLAELKIAQAHVWNR
jgi:hypothetical protein